MKHSLLPVSLLFAAVAAQAVPLDQVTITRTPWVLTPGGTTHSSEAKCIAAIPTPPVTEYHCIKDTKIVPKVAPPPPPPPPPPTGGVTVYLSDCQTGAVAGCVPGNNANAGTEASPKRDLSGVNINTLPAGSSVLFKRGGAWNVATRLDNPNARSDAPITLADYGTGALPILNTPSGTTFSFGMYGATAQDGGYTFRNLRLDGRGTGQWGAFVQGGTRDVTFDGVTFVGFDIGVHAQQSGGARNDRMTVRNSTFQANREHGILGDGHSMLLEGNTFEGNNPSGGGREHGVYLGGHGTNLIARDNRFIRNSAPNGVCDGGNFTIHGEWDGLLIENNLIEQTASTGGCYGLSVTAAYDAGYTEFFRNLVVRGNTFVNLGNCSVCLSSAPGALVENNKVYNTQASYHLGVQIPAINPGPGDVADGGAVIRNNVICHTGPTSGSTDVRAPSAATVTGNVYQTGAAATTGACAR